MLRLAILLCCLAGSACARQAGPEAIPVVGAVEGVVGAAAGEGGKNDVAASPYYPAFLETTSRTRIELQGLRTYQQTSEVSCGAACMIMALDYFGLPPETEQDLVRELDIPLPGLRRADGSYGCTTAALAQALRARGLEVTTAADTGGPDGTTFASPEAFAAFAREQLLQGNLLLTESVEWGGHWMILAGYDDMGTAETADDVLIFADPYDTTDHRQDGFIVRSLQRFFYTWFDAGVLPADQRVQQYVLVSGRSKEGTLKP